MKKGKLFWLAFYFLSPFALTTLVFLNKPPYLQQDPLYVGSILFGSFSYVWMTYQFIISARPKFIERHFGLDHFYRFHGIMALVSILMALGHFLIRRPAPFPIPWGLYALILFGITIVMASIFLMDTFLRRIKFIEAFRKFVDQKIGYKRFYSVISHNITLVAVVFLFIHVVTTSVAVISTPARILYIIHFALGMGFYIYHHIIRRIQLKRSAYTVIENRTENQSIHSLHLRPANGSILDYQPGQFALLSVHNDSISREPHPYTIASSPTQDHLEFIIKNSGDYTSQLDRIQTGDEVHIDGPFGVFTHQNYPDEENLVFIAGGIGITPFLSMLRSLQVVNPDKKVILLWGCRYKEDLILPEVFQQLETDMPNFKWYPVLSDEPDWPGETGFFNAEKLNRLAVNEIELTKTGFYTCGPGIMMKIVDEALQELGVSKSHIHYEKFAF